MVKRTLSLMVLLIVTTMVWAAPVNKQKAKQEAFKFLQSVGILPKQATRAEKNELRQVKQTSAYYIFNIGREKGFVVMSADDRTYPVLGYTQQGAFGTREMPEGLRDLLNYYQQELKWLNQYSMAKTSSQTKVIDNKPAIEPLMESKWNQTTPYNDLCPMDGTERSVTGCVATAITQIMYYHKCPQGVIEHPVEAYTTKTTQTKSTQLQPIQFDWNNMHPVYQGNERAEDKKAVAQLLQYVGQAVQMDYTKNSSSAYSINVPQALKKYFGYSKSTKFVKRSNFGYNEWNEMIYNELKNKRPVYYSASNEYNGGHAFVCDGYQKGDYFHINWGWGGMANGFYRLSILRPSQAGIGGQMGAYSLLQDAIIGIQPAKESETTDEKHLDVYSLKVATESDTRLDKNEDFWYLPITVMFSNMGESAISAKIGVGLFKDNQLIKVIAASYNTVDYEANPIKAHGQQLSSENFGKGLVGTYQLKAIYQLKGETEWKVGENADLYVVNITLSDLNLKVIKAEPKLKVTSIKYKGSKEIGSPLKITLNIENTGDKDMNEQLELYFSDKQTDKLASKAGGYIAAHSNNNIDFMVTPQQEGTLKFYIKRSDGSHLYDGSVKIGHYMNQSLPKVEILPELKNRCFTAPVMKGYIKVTNKEAGTYANGFDVQLYKLKANTKTGYMVETYHIEDEVLGKAESNLPFTFNTLEDGGKYFIIVYTYLSGKPNLSAQSYSYPAKTMVINGISNVSTSTLFDTLPIYNLYGIKVAVGSQNLRLLPKGVYIIGGKKVRK